jgi:hypothetical protein
VTPPWVEFRQMTCLAKSKEHKAKSEEQYEEIVEHQAESKEHFIFKEHYKAATT